MEEIILSLIFLGLGGWLWYYRWQHPENKSHAVLVNLFALFIMLCGFGNIADASNNIIKIAIGILLLILIIMIFIKRKEYINGYKYRKWSLRGLLLIAILSVIICFIGPFTPQSSNNPYYQPNLIGHKINHLYVKNHDDMYFTDKNDPNTKYFTNDNGKITAVKHSFLPNPKPATSVQISLVGILGDKNLKYTEDNESDSDFSPDGDTFNVWSSNTKKWYHVSMQRNSNDKVSSFSVWAGKDDNADDY